MDASQFKAVAQSLLKNPLFADFTIKCAGKQYRVHRLMLSCHSNCFREFFVTKTEHEQSGVVELLDDNPEAVDVMIKYFYSFEYDGNLKRNSMFADPLELHAAVYAVAEKYDVPDLKSLIVTKFCEDASTVLLQKRNALPAINMVYSSTPECDRGLRDAIIEFWTVASGFIIKHQGREVVEAFMQDNQAFLHDLALHYPTGPRDECPCWKGSGDLGRMLRMKACDGCGRPLSWTTRLALSMSTV